MSKILSTLMILVVILFSIKMGEMAIAIRSFVFQKDMSEYCRRRVMTSVFLGRRVVESQSQILHFSQLEVPYSCFISLRTELGSNIILVLQAAVDDTLEKSCKNNNSQVLVHEMGETFGGYWGPLPDEILKQNFVPSRNYVLKSTSPSTTTTSHKNRSTSKTVTTHVEPLSKSLTTTADNEDYLSYMIPLVNVSGKLGDKLWAQDVVSNNLDYLRRTGSQYSSTVVPLVQFSIWEQTKKHRKESNTQEKPLFELDYDLNDFTFDSRITFPFPLKYSTFKGRKSTKNRYNANRRFKFKKGRGSFFDSRTRITPNLQNKIAYWNKSFDKIPGQYDTINNLTSSSESWKYIEELLKEISGNYSEKNILGTNTEYNNVSMLLRKISKMDYNSSAYLISNLSEYNHQISTNILKNRSTTHTSDMTDHTIEQTIFKHTESNLSATLTTHAPINVTSTINYEKLSFDGKLKLNGTDNIEDINLPKEQLREINESKFRTHVILELKMSNVTFSKAPETKLLNGSEINGSHVNIDYDLNKRKDESATTTVKFTMVDHESWENIVQAAPVMAVLLNKTSESVKSRVRKKRYIKSISIKGAKPHVLTTRQQIQTTSESVYHFSDPQDFAQLVELQDDEIYGRIALKSIRRYVGAVLFNICDFREKKARHVFLFNSSRIVIAINNFTLKRMTLVATPAHTLMNQESSCNSDHIECQVSGARVCIDSITACDGVPNCGAYDIYDEDRLRCGAFKGLQHNVYLAAFTFLAVLLTLLYMVHYWLKRCVPKVSDAFFIYTDGSENVLFLDSVMQSPTDIDDGSKMVYRSHLFEGDMGSTVCIRSHNSAITKVKQFLLLCFCCKKKCEEKQESIEIAGPSKVYSFTQLEISKLDTETVEAAVQTGDSLEMQLKTKTNHTKPRPKIHNDTSETVPDFPTEKNDILSTNNEENSLHKSLDSELNMLNFFRNARAFVQANAVSSKARTISQILDKQDVATGNEMELHSTVYDLPSDSTVQTVTTQAEINLGTPDKLGSNRKRLRFNDNLTTIPSIEEENDQVEKRRQYVHLQSGKHTNQDLETIEEVQEHTSARDFMRFWGGTKSKKSKKKTQMSLR